MPDEIEVDFSGLPSEVVLAVSDQPHVRSLATAVAVALGLPEEERQVLRQELLAAVVETVRTYAES